MNSFIIERMAQGGYGIGHVGGRVVFVPYVIPGERVEVEIAFEKERYAFALPQRIVERSSDRVDPPCPYFGTCGGCQLQHMTYGAQLRWKGEIFRETLAKIARLPDPPVKAPLGASQIWNYRNRIQLKIDRKRRIGFYKADGHELVEIDRCLIADERLNEALVALDRRTAAKRANRFELIVNETGGVTFEVEKGPFSQVHPAQNAVLIEEVVRAAALSPHESVVELFCGNGNFTIPLARAAARVVSIDQNPLSVGEARVRADREGLKNIQFRVGQAVKMMRGLRAERPSYQVALLDPPRKGAHELLGDLVALRPERIVYVSCFPPTLARDIGYLARHGYRLEVVQPIDMFPQTHHLESVSLLVRIDSPPL